MKFPRYEFWPMWLFYFPYFPVWLINSLRSGSMIYMCNVNPKIKFGGLTQYSKSGVLSQIPQNYRPKEKLILKENLTHSAIFDFPFIVKPNIGERGKNVELIKNKTEWQNYIRDKNQDLIIQENINFPKEFGVFFAKNPNEKSGKILSITGKEFLTFHGDGKTSLREFIEKNERAKRRKAYLYLKFHDKQELVLQKGETLILEEIGNHNRGTLFFDASNLITEKLEKTINEIVENLDEFYYGRFDVKAASDHALKKGEFIILEINGANSEPTHIYDPKYSLSQAYKEVHRHFKTQFQIAQINKKRGYKFPSTTKFIKEVFPKIF